MKNLFPKTQSPKNVDYKLINIHLVSQFVHSDPTILERPRPQFSSWSNGITLVELNRKLPYCNCDAMPFLPPLSRMSSLYSLVNALGTTEAVIVLKCALLAPEALVLPISRGKWC